MNIESLKNTWKMFQREHGVSVDRMLCNPSLRSEFLAAIRLVIPNADEQQILWSVVRLRKGKKLPSVLK